MNTLFALNGSAHLALAIITFLGFLRLYSRGGLFRTHSGILATLGLGHLLIGTLQILWLFGTLQPLGSDLVLLLIGTFALSGMLLLYLCYRYTRNKHLIYVFLLSFVGFLCAPFAQGAFLYLVLGICFLITILAYSELLCFKNRLLRRSGLLGIASTLILIALFALIPFGWNSLAIPWFIPLLLLAGSYHFILKDMQEFGVLDNAPSAKHHPALHVGAVFIRFIIFVFSLCAFTFLSTVALHEFGHSIVGEYYGCEKHTAIIYDVTHKARTELVCQGPYDSFILTIAGFAITVLLGMVFLIVGDNFTVRLSTLILGFSLLIAYGDFSDLGLSPNLNALLAILATIVIMLSIIRISVFYLGHYHLFDEDVKGSLRRAARGDAHVTHIATYHDEAKNIKSQIGSKKARIRL